MSKAPTSILYRTRVLALLAGAALAVPVAPVAAVGDFQLPPSTSTPSVQGPIAPGVAPPRTATPTPAPRPAPTPTVAPAAALAPTPTAAPATARPSPGTSPAAVPAAAPIDTESEAPTESASETPDVLPQSRPPDAAPAETVAVPAEASSAGFTLPSWWPWAVGALALLAALAGAAILWLRRRNRDTEPDFEQRAIERPIVRRPIVNGPAVLPEPFPQPVPPAVPADEDAAHGPLSIAVEARELTISLSAATLTYRITLTNTGETALGGVAIAGDMVSAHASFSPEDQLANADSPLVPKHEIERIRPGESVQVTGEFRLPFNAIRPIVKGTAAMFVPLARLRVETAVGGNGALIRTALVGQRAATPGSGLQPFRLDLGPRIYREVTQKIF